MANKEDQVEEEPEPSTTTTTTTTSTTTTTTSRPPVTHIVTEIVTEWITETELVTKVEAVTEMGTQIVTELVATTEPILPAESSDLPKDWMAMTQEEAMALIRSGGVSTNFEEATGDEVEKLVSDLRPNGGFVQLSEEQALKLMADTVDRMDKVPMESEEEGVEPGPWELDGVSGSWQEVRESPPDFLETLGSPAAFTSILNSLPDVVADDWMLQASPQPWSATDNGDIFEFEIGAELPASGPAPAPEADILKPGLVIDDTASLHDTIKSTVISKPFLDIQDNRKEALGPFVGSIEPVSLDYGVYPEIQTAPEEQEVWYEPIVLGDAVPGPVREYEDYTDEDLATKEVTEEEREPELDCTMSILWGFQCSLSGVDEKKPTDARPYPVKRKDPLPVVEKPEVEYEDGLVYLDASDAVHGLVEVSPPYTDLGWVTQLPEEENINVRDLKESNKAATDGDGGAGFNQSGIEVSLPDQFLQTELGETVVEKEKDSQEIFDAFSTDFSKDLRKVQPRLDDKEVVVQYANLDKLIEDADLLKIFIDTLENQTISKDSSFSIKEVVLGKKKPKIENRNNEIDTKEDIKMEVNVEDRNNKITTNDKEVIEVEPVVEPEPEPEQDKEEVIEVEVVVEPEPESEPEQEEEEEHSSELPHPDFTTDKAVEERRRKRQCGVKGGRSVVEAYGKKASEYMMDFFIDSWVFGKDAKQKARFEDSQARIIGGKVTSTMLYCWIAAIVTKEGEFICTGTLVADDLVVTSGSCIN